LNKKLIAAVIILGFLASGISAYGFTFVPPPRQTFTGVGIVYTVEFECGNLYPNEPNNGVLPGLYATRILLHNNQPKAQFVYIKILDGFHNLTSWVKNPYTNLYRFVIQPDGLLDIDCNEIESSLPVPLSSPVFWEGFIIISQPNAQGNSPAQLDVAAAYTFEAFQLSSTSTGTSTIVGGSKNVVYISGTKVASVPTPCVQNIAVVNGACINLPP
jgi:hypothetical protein